MTDKEFKKLRRKDFIEIIYEFQKELEETKEELARVKRAKSQVDLIASLEAAKLEIEAMAEEAKNLESKLAFLKEELKTKEVQSRVEEIEEEETLPEEESIEKEESSDNEATEDESEDQEVH